MSLLVSLTDALIGTYTFKVVVCDGAEHNNSVGITVIVSDETTPSAQTQESKQIPKIYIILGTVIGAMVVVIILAIWAYVKFTKQVSFFQFLIDFYLLNLDIDLLNLDRDLLSLDKDLLDLDIDLLNLNTDIIATCKEVIPNCTAGVF